MLVDTAPHLGSRVHRRMGVAERALVDRARSLVGWSIGLTLYVVLLVAMFPSIRDNESFDAALEDYPDVLKDILGGEQAFDLTSATGFVGAELYALALPILFAVFTIGFAAKSVGGESESGQLELIVSLPLRRTRILLEKAAAMTFATVVLAMVTVVALLVAGAFVDLGLAVSRVLAVTVGLVLLSLFVGFVTMAAGSTTGRRASAVAAGSIVFGGSYLIHVLGTLSETLESVRSFSVYYHYYGHDPLRNGFPVGNYLVLLVLSGLALAVAAIVFDRRDLT